MKSNQKGFTLIELLVVVAVIGLLASLIIITLNNARAKSRDAKRLADIKKLHTVLEMFSQDNGSYPASTSGVPSGTPALIPGYMATWPAAPTPADTTTCSAAHGVVAGKTKNDYVYTQVNSGASYTIDFCLGAATGGYTAGVKISSPAGITPQ